MKLIALFHLLKETVRKIDVRVLKLEAKIDPWAEEIEHLHGDGKPKEELVDIAEDGTVTKQCNLEPCITPVLKTCVTVNALTEELKTAQERVSKMEPDTLYALSYKGILKKLELETGGVLQYVEKLKAELEDITASFHIARRDAANYKEWKELLHRKLSDAQNTIKDLKKGKKKVLFITGAKSPIYWYAHLIGEAVPYFDYNNESNKFRSSPGKFVDYDDAYILEV